MIDCSHRNTSTEGKLETLEIFYCRGNTGGRGREHARATALNAWYEGIQIFLCPLLLCENKGIFSKIAKTLFLK